MRQCQPSTYGEASQSVPRRSSQHKYGNLRLRTERAIASTPLAVTRALAERSNHLRFRNRPHSAKATMRSSSISSLDRSIDGHGGSSHDWVVLIETAGGSRNRCGRTVHPQKSDRHGAGGRSGRCGSSHGGGIGLRSYMTTTSKRYVASGSQSPSLSRGSPPVLHLLLS